MSIPGDKLMEVVKDKDTSFAISKLLSLDTESLVLICAFIIKVAEIKMTKNSVGSFLN